MSICNRNVTAFSLRKGLLCRMMDANAENVSFVFTLSIGVDNSDRNDL